MRRDLITALIAIAVFTVLLGVAYPLAITGVSQVALPGPADGSVIKRDDKKVGSSLLAQPFVIDTGNKDADGAAITRPDPRYFQPRPSATGYNPAATFFSNRGPNQNTARAFYAEQLAAYLDLEGAFNPGLDAGGVPVDAVTTSASGVDPHISEANARIQVARVAKQRKLSEGRVRDLVKDHTDDRALGLFGEPGVNVTELNLALDEVAR
jgi:K+-transporting ATPase ATPase C chain